jgi:tetratricopeptide (TPR) repeat protein
MIKVDAALSAAPGPARDAATDIAKELGGLPLAIDQAGAYVEETGCGLASYLALYRQRRAELLKRRGGFGPDHPESVATTFALSFDRVASSSLAAADLLRLCAFLHPDAIPEEIFTEGAAELGPSLSAVAAEPLELNAAFVEILKYSLLRRNAEAKTLGIHRLVQAVIQDGLTEEEKRRWAERAVRAVNKAFPYVEFANWAQCERLVSHALTCASLVESYSFEFEEAAQVLNKAGYYSKQRARLSHAEPLDQRALAIWEKILGPLHPNVATGLNNLAALYHAQGKYADAEPLHRRALAIRQKVLGLEHPAMATSLNNLAVLYKDQGKYAQAEPLAQRALAIWEKVFGPEHHNVATSLSNLAGLYYGQGDYARAQPLVQRALEVLEKALGPDHPDVAEVLHNYARLLREMKRSAAARELESRALAIRAAHAKNNPPSKA